MRFEQVREVLEHVTGFHRELAGEYRRLLGEAHDQRVHMLLAYLADHEDKMAAGLQRYEAEPHGAVLDTWMENAPDLSHPEDLEALKRSVDCVSTEQALIVAERIHQTLIEMYRALARQAAMAEERELFESLASGQEAEARRLSRDAARLESY